MFKLSKLKPLQDFIVIKRKPKETEINRGDFKIYLPETKVGKNRLCDVIAVGPGLKDDNFELMDMELKAGDVAVIHELDGIPIEGVLDEDGNELKDVIMVRQTDVVGKIVDDFPVPLAHRITVKKDEVQEKIGLIYLPDLAKKAPEAAEVVAVGKGKQISAEVRWPLEVEVGDRVSIMAYAGTEVKINNQSFHILEEGYINGVLV